MSKLRFGKFLELLAIVSLVTSASLITAQALDTGYHSPSAQAAGPGGDGNGFETNPTNVFADDSLFAADMLSGTSGSVDCMSSVRDRQDYFNYGFSVPSGSTITGVEVRLDAKVDATSNETPALCVQLSGDGGATWTAAKKTPTLSTSEATYLLGGATDTWGRSWSDINFSDSSLRVRVTTIAYSNQRNFYLDWLAVKVSYSGSSATATNTSVPTLTNTPTTGPSPTPTKTTIPPTATSIPPTATRTNTPLPTATPGGSGSPISIYGAWHCSNDYCIWGTVRDMTDFDHQNHWLIDRGDGSGKPSVNLVVLSFVEPWKLLNKTNDATTVNGVPRGITPEIVNYFTNHGVRVMLSIGGITYVTPWDNALTTNGRQLGLNAAEVARNLGVGIEIDWEENSPTTTEMNGLQDFINAYRSVLPYDPTGSNPAARLTIDLAAGDRWLIALTTKASTDWLTTANPVLDYANAMVARSDGTPSTWQEHIDGKPNYSPPIPPLAPAKFTGGLWLHGNSASCNNFANSPQNADANYVETVKPNGAGTTLGMLGFMFWAAECEGTRTTCTTPPNTCEGGMGVAAKTFDIPIPMPPLRQQ